MRQQLIYFGRTPSTMSGDQQALLITWLMLHSDRLRFNSAPHIKTAHEAAVGGVDSCTATETRKYRCQHTALWFVILKEDCTLLSYRSSNDLEVNSRII